MSETQETKKETTILANGPHENRTKKVAIVAVVALVAVAVMALLLWLFIPRGSGGRPVPAPRSIGPDQTANQPSNTPGESTLTITREQIQRAGIKIETVGERVSTETTGQQTTGVVQPNSYRETPVMSLVRGIVRTVGPELGQSVRRGQTIAVVSSNDLADAQTKYLAVIAELVHLAKALVEIKQLFDPTQARPDIAEARRDAVHLLEECIREDVTVDVDDCFLRHGAHQNLTRSAPLRPRISRASFGVAI